MALWEGEGESNFFSLFYCVIKKNYSLKPDIEVQRFFCKRPALFLSGIVLINFFLFFKTLKPSITAVRNAIDKSLAERDQNVDKFCSALDKDIADLGKQVKQVKQEAQVNNVSSFFMLLYRFEYFLASKQYFVLE